jgi:ATP-dependent Clp protease ATP-binding subunit ClpC
MPTSNQILKNSTYKVNEVFQSAITEAVNSQCQMLIPEFILYALIEQKGSIALRAATELGLDEVTVKTSIVGGVFDAINTRPRYVMQQSENSRVEGLQGTQEVVWLLDRAEIERKNQGDAYISTSSLFLAFFDSHLQSTRSILERAGYSLDETRKAIINLHKNHRITNRDDETKQSVLDEFTRDLTAMGRRGELDPVACRDEEIDRVIQILSRRKKNNPVLIGDPGVGKTVIIEGLVQRIISQEVPNYLIGKRVLSLEMADIVAGSKLHGEFEERLKSIKEEIVALEGEIILFIDEIHTVAGAGRTSGALDASNILKSALAKGQLQCIGATTFKEYKHYIESDSALERRFQPVQVKEPSLEQAKTMLQLLKPKYEKHHHIHYSEESLDAAVELSHRYITGRMLPDKAIDLLDEAGALKRIHVVNVPPEVQKLEQEKSRRSDERAMEFSKQNFARVAEIQVDMLALEAQIASRRQEWEAGIRPEDRVVQASDIATLVSRSTGIPVQRLQAEDLERLGKIEEQLGRRVIGQETAVAAVANALRRNRVGIRKRRAPIGSFLFLGPTGVGKTELAKALAGYVLDDESRIIRFDMSEFMERHEGAKLIGSPPGYVGYGEGGQLTERIRHQPYSVVLFDEIEKAHPDVFNLFLQILDDGRLTDAEGQVANFENSILIFTSNVGSEHINAGNRTLGLGAGERDLSNDEVERLATEELKKLFKPEFLNRLDEIIVFFKLGKEEIERIFELQIDNLRARLQEQGLELDLHPKARSTLVERGFDPLLGARPLRRVIEKELENRIAQEIVRVGKSPESGLVNGSRVTVREGSSPSHALVVTIE